MSIETWTQEFYPCRANSAEAHERAVDHSLQKWIGLRRENLEKHGLIQVGYRLYSAEDVTCLRPVFQIDVGTCSLCSVYHDSSADFVGSPDSDEWEPLPECRECPLSKVRDGVPCDYARKSETNSPYYLGTRPGGPDPEPMILWLIKAKELHDA